MPMRRSHFLLHLRNRHFLLLDALILCVTPTLALMLRVEGGKALEMYGPALLLYTVVALVVRLAVFYMLGLYARFWRYASVDELIQIVTAGVVSTMLIVMIVFAVRLPVLGICDAFKPACTLPRSIPFIDALLVVLAVGATRFSVRAAAQHVQRGPAGRSLQRVLIVGAGEAGTMIVREMNANPQVGLDPIGFVDDDPHKHGTRIRGLPVLGDRSALPYLVESTR